MNAVAITGADTINIFGRVLTDFANDDCGALAIPDELSTMNVGKNGNVIVAQNNSGLRGDMTLRLLRGSDDDAFLNGEIASFLADPASYELMQGQFVKRVGDGKGNVTNDTYILSAGAPKRIPGAVDNAQGTPDNSIVIYEIAFGNIQRGLL
jgi:hypothetical protein